MEYIYAALLLHKLGQAVNDGNLSKVISAAGATPDDAKIKTLVASLNGVDIASELANAQIAVAAPSAGAPVAKAEEKQEEKKAEESAAGLASLFG